jgi:hypothetical protein
MLYTHLRLVLPSGLFPTINLYAFLLSLVHATCPTHFILLDLIILIILEEHKSQRSSLCNFLHPPVTSSLFGPNILSTLFSNNLSLCSFRNVEDQVSHPYRTTEKIIVLYILTFTFFDSRREDKWFWTKW